MNTRIQRIQTILGDRDRLSNGSNGICRINEFGVIFVYQCLHGGIEEADGLCEGGGGVEECVCGRGGDEFGCVLVGAEGWGVDICVGW